MHNKLQYINETWLNWKLIKNKFIIHKIIGRIIGGWGSKHCSFFVRLALSMSEINENVFNIEKIRYLRKSYPASKLFIIV